jgi:hypothetical protein
LDSHAFFFHHANVISDSATNNALDRYFHRTITERIMSSNQTEQDAAQVEIAKRAMEMKTAAPAPHHPAPDQTSNPGMNDTPNTKIAPSGAFDAEGQRPVLERSRKVR